jgi:hypothetical protein
MAVDMIRAQSSDKGSDAAGAAAIGAPGLGMVSATVAKTQVPAALLTGIDAMERSAEQEALMRSAGAEKRKFVAPDDEETEEPPRKGVKDADEIDI